MTKLTQQEIEKEREAFEEYFHSIYQEKINQEWMSECHCYMSDGLQERFKFWLVRAELAKGEKADEIKSPSYQELKRRKENRLTYSQSEKI